MQLFLPLVPVLAMLMAVSVACADVTCRASVSYKWEKGDAENSTHWRDLRAVAKDEEAAKRSLAELTNIEKTRAAQGCVVQHENLSGCISTKFSTTSPTYHSLSFAARKALEDAITKDCAAVQGSCGAAQASEPQCKDESVQPSPSATAVPAQEKKKK